MKHFKIYKSKKDKGSGGGLHGINSGLHCGEWFSVALMNYSNLDCSITQIYFNKTDSIDDGLILEIEGNETGHLKTDEHCLRAVCVHNPTIIYKMMGEMRKLGIKQGRKELKEDFKKLFNI